MKRRALFVLVSAVSVLVIAGVFIAAAVRSGDDGPAPTAEKPIEPGDVLAVGLDGRSPQNVGRVVVVPGGDATAARRVTALRCKRVAYAGGSGICVDERRVFPTRVYTARFFDENQDVIGSVPVNGFPSRTRVSPGGTYAAATTFVHGDSYATAGQFSTRTVIFDARRAKRLADLEKLTFTRKGKPITAVDRNFWGVTFQGDDGDFYATLATGDHHYLVRGNVRTRSGTVVRDGVECPSLSPDGTRLAFKARVGDPFVWRLRILDLRTGRERQLPIPYAFDDQAEWLDDQHIAYDHNETVMRIKADGSAPPALLLDRATSSASVR
jgi:hypothetical protein